MGRRIHTAAILLCATRHSVAMIKLAGFLWVVSALAIASSARAAGMMLMDRHLGLTPVSLVSMDQSRVSYFDAQGSLQTRPTTNYLQLQISVPPGISPASGSIPGTSPAPENLPADSSTPPAETTPPQPPTATTQPDTQKLPGGGVVTLIDGQRLIGQLVATDDKGQIMRWQSPWVGQLVFKLDRVRSWRQGAQTALEQQALNDAAVAVVTQDRLVLTNGDELAGYVVSVTMTSVRFQPAGSEKAVDIARSSVASMTLANTPMAQKQKTSVALLADGSQLRLTNFLIEQGKLSFKPLLGRDDQMATVDLSKLRRLDMANDRWCLVAWSDLPYKVKAGGKVFDAPAPPRLDHDVLRLHAPLTMTFTLPKGAAAVGADASLDIAEDDVARNWADVIVTLQASPEASPQVAPETSSADTSKDGSQSHVALNADHPNGRLVATTLGHVLTLTLDPALNGPIMDRVKLTNAWVVVPVRP